MSTRSLSFHAGIAFVVLAISYALFTLFPGVIPHPEDLSPYAYAIAFLACVIVWQRVPQGNRKWLYLPILVLCLLALLDEAGYGSEVMNIAPFYSETMHTEIRDLHNAIALGIGLLTDWLQDMRWDWILFWIFLAIDAVLIVAGIFFGWLLRLGMAKATEAGWKQRSLSLAAGFLTAITLATAIYLLSLPPDPRNALLFGYSAVRLASILLIAGLGFAPVVSLWQLGSKVLVNKVNGFFKSAVGKVLVYSLPLVILGLSLYQFYAPFLFLPDERTRLARLLPLLIWALSVSLFLLLASLAWRGRFRRSVTEFAADIINFFRREPAFFYVGAALLLIALAQLNDKDLIPLDEWIKTPAYRITRWGLWTEEIFETVGAFLFIASSLHFYKEKPRRLK